MNEAGVFGRFIPDFGRVVAQMQFDMYHHYTVDEHSIRAIGLLSRIERGELQEEHKLATALFKLIASRRALYVAVLLHDIAKGRGGDHSVLGAEVALALCPRLGLTAAETETVAWLVRWHLLMSATAFKRDLADPKTIQDFVEQVKSLERLRLLFLLTVVDIRAVGPGTWNSWKSQLLRALFDAGEEMLRLGHKQKGRKERIAAIQAELAERLGWEESRFARFTWRLPDSYWLAEPIEVIERNARFLDAADRDSGPDRAGRGAGPGRSAAPPWSRSTPRTSRASSTASPARSALPAATSSTPASTPPTTAWRSTISWSRTSSRGAVRRSAPARPAQGRGGRGARGARALGRPARRARLAAAPRRSLPHPAGRVRR